MLKWKCPHCNESMYGSWESPDDKTVKCIKCGIYFKNPYYKSQRTKRLDSQHICQK